MTICDASNDKCATFNFTEEETKRFFELNYNGESCPVSAGDWVIASQSLILAMLIWPMIALYKTNTIVRWKRATSLGLLLLSLILSFTAIGVWYIKCVRRFNVDPCTDCKPPYPYEVSGEVSGAFGFQCVIMVMLFATIVCYFVYSYIGRKEVSSNTPLMNDDSNSDSYYRAY
jgi:hypothetical protein